MYLTSKEKTIWIIFLLFFSVVIPLNIIRENKQWEAECSRASKYAKDYKVTTVVVQIFQGYHSVGFETHIKNDGRYDYYFVKKEFKP